MGNIDTLSQQLDHFDFTKSRVFLVIGAMGSGKTEYCGRIFNDARVLQKANKSKELFDYNGYSKIDVMYLKNISDIDRFPDYPKNSIAYRSGQIISENVYIVKDASDIKASLQSNKTCGTIILDEPCFYSKQAIDILVEEKEKRNAILVFTSLVYNFKKEYFNDIAEHLSDMANDTLKITCYCNHPQCTKNSTYSYRYYTIKTSKGELEVPAPYFDPVVIIGGIQETNSHIYPNYCVRCENHHYINGQEYTNSTLTQLGFDDLIKELESVKHNLQKSIFYKAYTKQYAKNDIILNVFKLDYLAERMLVYLCKNKFINQNETHKIKNTLKLDNEYLRMFGV